MKKMLLVIVLVLGSLGAVIGLTAESDKTASTITPCVVLTGVDSRIPQPEYHRVTTMKDWISLWLRHKGLESEKEYDTFHNPAGMPLVDFERFMVVAIFQGDGWNSAGLEAVSITEEQKRIVFRYEDKLYQTVGPPPDGGGKRVSVYGFFVIPRSAKEAVLEQNVQSSKVGPPEWKERITFPEL